jgi:hypothetical protein
MEEYEITYDYYGKAYMKCGQFIELSNRKSTDPHTIITIHNSCYKRVTIANFVSYIDNPIFPYIIQYYCRVIK